MYFYEAASRITLAEVKIKVHMHLYILSNSFIVIVSFHRVISFRHAIFEVPQISAR